jgi:hydroxyjasmonate sulfotransferase
LPNPPWLEKNESKHGGPAAGEEESLLSTLPMREGWWQPFFNLKGYWFPTSYMKSIMLMQAQFQPRPDDVVLATFPKCGTTWLKALAFTILNRSRYPIAGDDHPLLTNSPQELVPYLELPHRHPYPMAELEALPSPRLLSTHLPLTLLPSGILNLVGCRVVYLCREPKDVLVSNWYHDQKIDKARFVEFDKAFEFFCEGFSFYGPIWEHCLGYWKQSLIEPSKVLFLKYDDLVVAPTKHVKILAEFLRVPFTDEEERDGVVDEVVRLCSFENLKSLPVNSDGVVNRRLGGGVVLVPNSVFFRNGKVGDWVNHMTDEMAQKLNSIIEEKLKGSGLTF